MAGELARRHQCGVGRRHCAVAQNTLDELKGVREIERARDVWRMDWSVADVAHLLVRIHVWSVDHGPREACRVLVSRARELGSASSAGSQSLVLG